MKRLLVLLSVLQMQLYGAQEDMSWKEPFIKDATTRHIGGYEMCGSIVKILFDGSEECSLFLYRHNDTGVTYFSPIFTPLQDIEKIQDQCALFDAVCDDNKRLFEQSLRNGADINREDCRCPTILFTAQGDDGAIFTMDDFKQIKQKKIPFLLALAPYHFYGVDTYCWHAEAYAYHYARPTMLKLIAAAGRNFTKESSLPLNLDTYMEAVKKQDARLGVLQIEREIPTFSIMGNAQALSALSYDAQHIKLIASPHYDKEFQALIMQDDIQLYTTDMQKISREYIFEREILAQLYATAVCFTKKEGEKIAELYKLWRGLDAFRIAVFNYTMRYMQEHFCIKKPIMVGTLCLLVKHALVHDNSCVALHNMLDTLLRYVVPMAYTVEGEKIYNALLAMMVQYPQMRENIKILCNHEKATFQLTMKPFMQETIFRTYMAKLLCHSKREKVIAESVIDFTQMPKTLLEYILSFWKPEKRFIDACMGRYY